MNKHKFESCVMTVIYMVIVIGFCVWVGIKK